MAVSYMTSIPGIIKITEEVLNFIAFICVACASFITPKADAFLVASVGSFIITAIFLCLYVLDLQDKISLPWIKIQFFYCAIWALFYLITSSLILDEGITSALRINSYIAGGVFGIFATLVYCVDAFFKYQKQV